MSEKKISFLTDDDGNPSLNRILCLLVVVVGLTIGVLGALKGNLNASSVTLSTSLVTIGLAGKSISKKLEIDG